MFNDNDNEWSPAFLDFSLLSFQFQSIEINIVYILACCLGIVHLTLPHLRRVTWLMLCTCFCAKMYIPLYKLYSSYSRLLHQTDFIEFLTYGIEVGASTLCAGLFLRVVWHTSCSESNSAQDASNNDCLIPTSTLPMNGIQLYVNNIDDLVRMLFKLVSTYLKKTQDGRIMIIANQSIEKFCVVEVHLKCGVAKITNASRFSLTDRTRISYNDDDLIIILPIKVTNIQILFVYYGSLWGKKECGRLCIDIERISARIRLQIKVGTLRICDLSVGDLDIGLVQTRFIVIEGPATSSFNIYKARVHEQVIAVIKDYAKNAANQLRQMYPNYFSPIRRNWAK